MKLLLIVSLALAIMAQSRQIMLSPDQEQMIGRRIWYNETRLAVEELVHWNEGEEFAAMGIGHFVWYPDGQKRRFNEDFPRLVRFLIANNVSLPAWLTPTTPCPWSSRAEFAKNRNSAKAKELRELMVNTVALQVRFMVRRSQQALPGLLAHQSPSDRARIESQFWRIADSPGGAYVLVDYLNFKGDGTLLTERYQGLGWGLRQVLRCMKGQGPGPEALAEFSTCADSLLVQRVANSPRERGEKRWINNWRHRVMTYRRPEHPADLR